MGVKVLKNQLISHPTMKYLNMSQEEVERYKVLSRCLKNKLTVKSAAELLGLSERHVYRLKNKVEQQGAEGLIHGNRGRKSNSKMSDEERKEIVELLKEKYSDFKPGFATEKLKEEGHDWSSETIRQIMIEEDLWKVNSRKQVEFYAKRPRKEHYGALVQFDGSYHEWFEERASECCLLAAVDDATSQLVGARFVTNENLNDIFAFWRDYLLNKGKPKAVYTDKLMAYHNNFVAEQRDDRLTQFQRAMKGLNVELIAANSPQAKGRVERVFDTLQDRMIKEMRLEGIDSREQGNEFLGKFVEEYNEKYGKAPEQQGDFHRELSEREEELLPRYLCKQEERVIQNDFTVRYDNQVYQLTEDQPVTVRKKSKVKIEERPDSSLKFRLKGEYLNFEEATAKKRYSLEDNSWIIPGNKKVEA